MAKQPPSAMIVREVSAFLIVDVKSIYRFVKW